MDMLVPSRVSLYVCIYIYTSDICILTQESFVFFFSGARIEVKRLSVEFFCGG